MITQSDITRVIKDPAWQSTRLRMKGMSTDQKIGTCVHWLILRGFSRDSEVQVENYLNALRRGGLLPPQKTRR